MWNETRRNARYSIWWLTISYFFFDKQILKQFCNLLLMIHPVHTMRYAFIIEKKAFWY